METNEIIAAFMGMKKGVIVDEVGYYSNDELEYHLSWDWLMPVVEKIELLTNMADQLYIMTEYDNREEFKGYYWRIDVGTRTLISSSDIRFSSKLEATYDCVYEFIVFYNK